ncbi:MAG: hypothetical protein IKI64_11650 [Clostridia bacterium]|nr:hypothetical protein [Clostridia bacterium]
MEESIKLTRYIPHLPYNISMYCIGNPTRDNPSNSTTVYYYKDSAISKANGQPISKILIVKDTPANLHIYLEDGVGAKEEMEIETARITDCKGFFLYE